MTLRLHTDTESSSPYAMSVFVALREKGLPFEHATVDLAAGHHRGPAFAALSVTRRVPTLEHDGVVLTESSAITEYLDEAFPDTGTRLYPRDRVDRARARQVQAWLRSDLMPIREQRSAETVFRRPAQPLPPLDEAGRAAADKLFDVADRLLPAGAPHLFGDWSLADTDLAMMLQRLVTHGDPVPAHLAAYAQAQWQRPSVLAWRALPRTAA